MYLFRISFIKWGPLWPWLYSSWIYYLCNQCLSPHKTSTQSDIGVKNDPDA